LEPAAILASLFPRKRSAGGSGTVFLDSGTPDRPGGTGKSFDWQTALPMAEEMRRRSLNLVVSGGLNRDNVARAIELLDPWGVDVSSGVEVAPGKKDREKIKAFVSSVREAQLARGKH
jgi:phosphoribosylanthranilate isomerase